MTEDGLKCFLCGSDKDFPIKTVGLSFCDGLEESFKKENIQTKNNQISVCFGCEKEWAPLWVDAFTSFVKTKLSKD